jgi:hypothetical protein
MFLKEVAPAMSFTNEGKVQAIAIGLLLTAGCAAVIWLICFIDTRAGTRARMRAYTTGHYIANTRSNMHQFGLMVQFVAEESESQPPNNLKALLGYIEEFDAAYIRMMVESEIGIDPNAGSFFDPSGNPIKLVVNSPNDYVFISPGPNHKDENGQGDDIVYQFDPLERRNKVRNADKSL